MKISIADPIAYFYYGLAALLGFLVVLLVAIPLWPSRDALNNLTLAVVMVAVAVINVCIAGMTFGGPRLNKICSVGATVIGALLTATGSIAVAPDAWVATLQFATLVMGILGVGFVLYTQRKPGGLTELQ